MSVFRLVAIPCVIFLAIGTGVFCRLLSDRSRGRASRLLCRMTCRALGLRVTVTGEPPAGRPTLMLSNHVSWTDILAFGAIAPVCFLARHDVAGWPALGLLARLFGTLFVERGRIRQIPAVNAQMASRMRKGDVVALFPEATTGDGTRVGRFHAVHLAAARDLLRADPHVAAVAIAPAAIVYARRRGLTLGRDERARVAWYGDSEFAPHLLELVRDGGAECQISYLPSLSYNRQSDRKAVARAAEAAVGAEVRRVLTGIGGTTMDLGVISPSPGI